MSGPEHEIIEGDETPDLPPARPAATLVVFDESEEGPPRHLMVRRSQAMMFAGGAVVFPGGRVDADDALLAAEFALAGVEHEDAAARIAAIRETIEETGLAVACGEAGEDPGLISVVRAGLAAGEMFSTLVERHRLELDLAALVPFARWNPKLNHSRRFDTRFFVARGRADAASLSVDGSENSLLFWKSAAGTLAMAARGEIEIIFPTRRNLERLAGYASYAEAIRCAALHPVAVISPWIERRGDDRWLVIPQGHGYPVTEERLENAARG